jgi:hypothetical protein
MENNNRTPAGNNEVNTSRLNKPAGQDLQDSARDEEKMKPETVILDLPEVADIPGQEHITVPQLREMFDTTISSADEEGAAIFDDEDDTQDALIDDDEVDVDSGFVTGNDADVSAEEVTMLTRADEDMPTEDNLRLRRTELDQTDNDGDPLNEGSIATDVSGSDLDISGADLDDPLEEIGEEDEENNFYSLGGDSKD